ncbi:type II toxin-antitoxin system RelE/ParE family toxin [Alphaproteobacteria bacterium]|nr:type II toxin-antitoxin system RelE/ParE family toxin [Alphaproteobacteria bacterium]
MEEKQVDWVGSSLDDLKKFPETVKQTFGFELHQVQHGTTPDGAKSLKGKGLSGVYELRDNHNGSTYRAVYIAKLKNKIYVLHCFQKKSKSGIATPKQDIDLIKTRLKIAIENTEKASKKQ